MLNAMLKNIIIIPTYTHRNLITTRRSHPFSVYYAALYAGYATMSVFLAISLPYRSTDHYRSIITYNDMDSDDVACYTFVDGRIHAPNSDG
jgi:hypothetical protein